MIHLERAHLLINLEASMILLNTPFVLLNNANTIFTLISRSTDVGTQEMLQYNEMQSGKC